MNLSDLRILKNAIERYKKWVIFYLPLPLVTRILDGMRDGGDFYPLSFLVTLKNEMSRGKRWEDCGDFLFFLLLSDFMKGKVLFIKTKHSTNEQTLLRPTELTGC